MACDDRPRTRLKNAAEDGVGEADMIAKLEETEGKESMQGAM